MPELGGMTDKNTLTLLREKWGLADEADKERAGFTSLILENQSRHFTRLVEETRAIWGPTDWSSDLLDSLKSRLMTHPLYDLCGMQPMTGPIGVVYYYRPQSGTTVMTNANTGEEIRVPEIVLSIEPITITAESRRLKGFVGADESVDGMVVELLTELSREIINTMMPTAPESGNYVTEDADHWEELRRAAHVIHRRSQRAPANRIVANAEMLTKLGIECPDDDSAYIQSMGEHDGRLVFLDPAFPKGQILAWYQGATPLDTGLIFSPYIMVEITPNFVDPTDGTLRRALRTRHKLTVVRPEFSYLIKTETA